MNYETYKRLNTRLKEEYNFKFRDKNKYIINPTVCLFGCSTLFSIMLVNIAYSYLIMIDPENIFGHLKDRVHEILFSSVKLMSVIVCFVSVCIIVDCIRVILNINSERLWIKVNNIRVIKVPFLLALKGY